MLAVATTGASAQNTSTDPVDTARFQFGPLGITPRGALTNIGVDGNVFNTVENRQRDFTFTLTPEVAAWLRAGRTRTSLVGRTDFVYFREFASERSVDGALDLRIDVLGNRVAPWVAGNVQSRRQRLGNDIDIRSRQRTTSGAIGADLRAGSRTTIRASVSRSDRRFDGDAVLLGSRLQETLNRTEDIVGLEYRQERSVLTTMVLHVEGLRDRFPFSPERDATSVRIRAGFDLDEFALIDGQVRIGVRRLTGSGGGAPDFTGAVLSATTGFSLWGRTRVEFTASRDVNYSFEKELPYYIGTGGGISFTPRLSQDWDIQMRASGERLGYRALVGSDTPDRLDRFVSTGGGIGYHLNSQIRIGFNVDYDRRRSPLHARDYAGYRVGTSITYGN